MGDDLKLCPFCGGEAAIENDGIYRWVECQNEKCRAMSHAFAFLVDAGNGDALVAKNWNARPLEDAANARAEAAEARFKMAKDFIGHIMVLGLLRVSPRLRDEALKILDGNDDLEKGGGMTKLLLDDYDKLQVHKDGDAYFVCGPDFVDLQTSTVVWYSLDTPDGLVLHQWFGVSANPIIHLPLTEICWIIEKLNRGMKGGEG